MIYKRNNRKFSLIALLTLGVIVNFALPAAQATSLVASVAPGD